LWNKFEWKKHQGVLEREEQIQFEVWKMLLEMEEGREEERWYDLNSS
jgi:hypothetical protein